MKRMNNIQACNLKSKTFAGCSLPSDQFSVSTGLSEKGMSDLPPYMTGNKAMQDLQFQAGSQFAYKS